MAYILSYQGNWADEIDLEGFMLMSDELYEKYKTFTEAHPEILNERINMYVGSNEDTHYRLSDIGVKPISEEDKKTIINALGIHWYSSYADYGDFPDILDDINNWCEGKEIDCYFWD